MPMKPLAYFFNICMNKCGIKNICKIKEIIVNYPEKPAQK